MCLKQGMACKGLLDVQYRRYGLACKRGRLTRLPKTTIFSALVDVGGYRLAMLCRGTGAPTVVTESGFDNSGWEFSRVQTKVAKTARFCFYDRAGLGASDPRKPPGPVPAVRVAEELHALLMGAGIKPPYVLGGWSIGGFFVRLYTERYPDEVLGLVTLDGTPFGLPPGLPPVPPGGDLIQGRESFYLAAADAEVATSPSLGARPLVVLTHGGEIPPPGSGRGHVAEAAEAGRPPFNLVDPRPRRHFGSWDRDRPTQPHRRGVPSGHRGGSRTQRPSGLRADAAAALARHLPRSKQPLANLAASAA
jgi:pimeloyl-ACP methyl ester carboxylesterase